MSSTTRGMRRLDKRRAARNRMKPFFIRLPTHPAAAGWSSRVASTATPNHHSTRGTGPAGYTSTSGCRIHVSLTDARQETRSKRRETRGAWRETSGAQRPNAAQDKIVEMPPGKVPLRSSRGVCSARSAADDCSGGHPSPPGSSLRCMSLRNRCPGAPRNLRPPAE